MAEEQVLLKVVDVAGRLSLSRNKVYELIREGRLRSVKVPGPGDDRAIRVPVEALHEFVDSMSDAADADGPTAA